MMLASPLLPAPMFSQDESMHYRPAKDMDAFNSLLPPPIQFVEGSSSGTLAVAEGRYEPINASPKLLKPELQDAPNAPPIHSPTKPAPAPPHTTGAKASSLHLSPIDLTWPQTCNIGSGLFNSGNTCFLNSALQCLLHTPPLLRLLISHRTEECRVSSGFCMACGLRSVVIKSHKGKNAFSPAPITNNLQVIAKHIRKGRQEDTHEFLRYAIDALQKSCLAGHPRKIDAKLAETTWVHKIFGGRLRSRVTCRDCGYNSDTFDSILDLSLDIFKCDSLKDALRKFIAIDYLKGADKYKCEKCKKHVNAEKRFTIHDAPPVLTVHLKRFSPLGRKITHPLEYDEDLTLQPYMSSGQFGPSYSLFGVICHAGGGPNSGHYYAFVKSKEGRWYEMNDETVQPTSLPTGKRNAYMLFYIQNKGQGLEAAVKAPILNGHTVPIRNGLAAKMKKKVQKDRDDTDEEEDKGVRVNAPLIGPLLPSAEITKNVTTSQPSSPIDPQAMSLKSKIQAVAQSKARKALESLGNYDSEDGSSDEKERSKSIGAEHKDDRMNVDNGKSREDDITPLATKLPSPPTAPPTSSLGPVPAAQFYSNSGKNKKRKFSEARTSTPLSARTNGYQQTTNPFSRPTPKRKRMGI